MMAIMMGGACVGILPFLMYSSGKTIRSGDVAEFARQRVGVSGLRGDLHSIPNAII